MDQVEPSPRPASPSSIGRVLRQRNFWPYFAGNVLSSSGGWFHMIAQAILVFRLTESTFAVGLVNFAQAIGILLTVSWAGTAADRFDRRRLLIITQAVSIILTGGLAALTAADLVNTPVVILVAFLLGLTVAFAIPAMQAMVPALVAPADLGPAITLNSLSFNVARAVGAGTGALVVQHLGLAAAFALNSVSYLALIAGLLAVRPRPVDSGTASSTGLRDSLAMIRRHFRLALLLVGVAAIATTTEPVNTLTPGFATEIFDASDSLTGYLVGAFGVGSVLAAVTLGSRSGNFDRRLKVAVVVQGAAIAAFAVSGSAAAGIIALAVAGFGYLIANTSATTLLQLEVEERHRGRVMALWSVAFLGLRPFASLADGALAAVAGLRVAALVFAFPALLFGAVFALRARRHPAAPTPGEAAPSPAATSPGLPVVEAPLDGSPPPR